MQKHIAIALLLGFAGFAAQPARAQAAGTSKTAEEVYKNIVQLKGTPADQLMPAMQFMASSLGAECAFCHVQGQMESDDKPAKRTARAMIAMTAAIDKDNFRGQLQVTCFSCHRGSARPVNTGAQCNQGRSRFRAETQMRRWRCPAAALLAGNNQAR